MPRSMPDAIAILQGGNVAYRNIKAGTRFAFATNARGDECEKLADGRYRIVTGPMAGQFCCAGPMAACIVRR